MTDAAPQPAPELLGEFAVTVEDLRARLALARCRMCDRHIGADPLNPPVPFEGELVHQACAEWEAQAALAEDAGEEEQ